VDKSILAIDIGTTNIVSIVAQNDFNDKINILGIGKSISHGINKGTIIDIDQVSTSIKDAVELARSSYGSEIDSTYVSISGIHTRSKRSHGSINIPSGHITSKEIKQVLSIALYDAQIVPDYEAIHVIPLYFKVDGNNSIQNPLNMNGSRLEVEANIITAKKTAITNIQNALKKSNLDATNFVLTSYASTISTLDNDNKNLGVATIDLGGSTSEFSIFKNKSLLYNDVVPIGSEHLTNDLSIILRTPTNAADEIKKKYASLIPMDELSETTIKKIKVPILGNESELEETSLEYIQTIMHARVEEILCLIQQKLQNSALYDKVNTIVLTGGMSKIPGIDRLAKQIFEDIPVQLANPKNIQNGYINFNDPTLSTIVGLLMYGLDTDPFFELDSNKNLKEKFVRENIQVEKVQAQKNVQKENIEQPLKANSTITEDDRLDTLEIKKEKKSMFSGMWKKFSEWV
jgi:cell division protein FtsA